MRSTPPQPRGLVTRSAAAAVVFAAAVAPGWLLAGRVEHWTGSAPIGYLVTTTWMAGAIVLLAPNASYRRTDAVAAVVPVLNLYLAGVLSWRVALLPFRDWEPRDDERHRARYVDDPAYPTLWRLAPPRRLAAPRYARRE